MFGRFPPVNIGNEGGEVTPDRLVTEPLHGFRTWMVGADVYGLALRSVGQPKYSWTNPETAQCMVKQPHVAPDPSCTCGLYAQLPDQPIAEWEGYRKGRVSATGTIAMSGRIIICEKGFKAQHAEIVSSVVLDVSCAWSNGKHRCMADVSHVDTSDLAFLRAWCADHAFKEGRQLQDSREWLGHACDLLAERYEGVDFLTWQI